MADWKIDRRASACRRCEHPFDEGERFASCLSILAEELVREDLCPRCWKASIPGAEGELFWWFTRYEADRRKSVQLDLESLERLFLVLEGRPEQAVRELRFLLCLVLLRKKRLKVERIERGNDGESFVVKRPRRDERHEVYVFDFDAARMQELRTKLQAIFDGADLEDGFTLKVGDGEPQHATSEPSAGFDPASPQLP